jgi:hypothetical protein
MSPMAGPAWFTVIPRPEVGFTDQLMQLSLFGRLGHALGLAFRYTPVVNERTHESVWQDFGIAQAFAERTLDPAAPLTDVPVSDKYLKRRAIRDADDLLAKLRADIADVPAGRVIAFRIDGARRGLTRLVVKRPDLFPWPEAPEIRQAIQTAVPDTPFPHDARPKIAVHVRRGDVTVINAPWGTGYKIRPVERFIVSPEPLGAYHLRDFYTALKRLQEAAGPNAASALFSDGCGRARSILESRPDAELGVDANRRRALMDYCEFEDLAFDAFRTLPATDVDVGESLSGFRRLVRALMDADIVLYSNAQRLAPKLIGAIGRPGAEKMLAELVHADAYDPEKVREAGVSPDLAHFHPIHPQTFEMDPVLRFAGALGSG